MKTGDIIVLHGTSIISKIIQRWSYWTHIRVAISSTEFLEATWPKVRKGHILELQGEDYKVMTHVVPLNNIEQAELVNFCLSMIGKRYDWRGLISFIIRKNVQNKSWYFCSEFAKEACEKANRPLLRRKSSWTTPDDIYSSLMLTEI